jgi:hypothetical protein
VLEHLLRDFRSAKLRKQFFSHDPKEYSDTLDVKVLVRHAAGCQQQAQQEVAVAVFAAAADEQ